MKCRDMRHDCEKHGCFEKKYRCKLGRLDHLLPGNNGFTDIDGCCHINGHYFFLEWKRGGAGPGPKQQAALKGLSEKYGQVIIGWGDPNTMEPDVFWHIVNGEIHIVNVDANQKFGQIIQDWGERACIEDLESARD